MNSNYLCEHFECNHTFFDFLITKERIVKEKKGKSIENKLGVAELEQKACMLVS